MISNDEMQEVIDTSDRLVEATKLDNDGVERGVGNKIPLWLFGFLY